MLQELGKNDSTIPLEDKVSFQTLCDDFQKMDKDSILGVLNRKKKDLGLYQTSYGIYYLANHYIQAAEFQLTMEYLHIAADEYLNPLAMLRLARVYFSTPDRIKASFPQMVAEFNQDLAKAYYYINAALALGNLIHKTFGDKYILDVVTSNGLAVLDSYNLGSVRGQFDYEGAEKVLPTQMANLEAAYKKMYGIK